MTALTDALALALVHFLWQGAALAVIAALLMWMARGSARARYAIGIGALCAMVIAPVVTAAWLFDAVPAEALVEQAPVTPAIELPVSDVLFASEPATMSAPGAGESFPYAVPIVLVWALGVVLLSVRLIGGWLVAHRLATRAVKPVAVEVNAMARALALRLRLSRPVRVLESSVVAVPVMIGWLKPVVLLPTSTLMGLAPEQLEALIAHEFAHVRRYDYLVNLLQSAVETTLFYHPAVWWVSHRVRVEREHCCDDLAVSVTERVTYVEALSTVASLTAPGVALAAADGSLRGRVRRLLGPERERQARAGWQIVLPLVLVAAVAVPGAVTPAVNPVDNSTEFPIEVLESPAALPLPVTSSLIPLFGGLSLSPAPPSFRQAGHRITAGDRLRMQFDGTSSFDADMNQDVAVTPQGTITVKYLNDVDVSGLTTTQAAAQVLGLLEDSEIFNRGTVGLTIDLVGPAQVGSAPGSAREDSQPVESQPTEPAGQDQQQKAMAELEAQVASGKVKPGETITVNVAGRPELSGTYVVQPDGTIKLKGLAVPTASVLVRGAVRYPGVHELAGDLSLKRAIELAGGYGVNAGPDVEVFRSDSDGNPVKLTVSRATVDTGGGPSLGQGNQVNVPLVPKLSLAVTGAVLRPGVVEVDSKFPQIAEALRLVGGLTPDAPDHVELIRTAAGESTTLSVSKADVESFNAPTLLDGDRINVPKRQPVNIVVSGAVRTPGVIVLRADQAGVNRAIAAVGGYTANAGQTVEILRRESSGWTVKATVTRDDLALNADPGLQDGDRINVPVGEVFYINGEVNRQGQKMWEAGMTVEMALAIGGGTTDKFSMGRSKIQRPVLDENGNVVKYEDIKDLKLETLILPGDVLVAGRKWM